MRIIIGIASAAFLLLCQHAYAGACQELGMSNCAPVVRPNPTDEPHCNARCQAEEDAEFKRVQKEKRDAEIQRQEEETRENYRNLARKQNLEGVEALKKGDYESAINYFIQSMRNSPGVQLYEDNYNKAVEQKRIWQEKQAEVTRLDNKASQQINDLRQLSRGQDAANTGQCPPVTSSSVVDACNVPSGLPKGVETSLVNLFGDATEDVRVRVRKGWQAVMAHNWQLATVYFQGALAKDPGNPDLIRWIQIMNNPTTSNKENNSTISNNELSLLDRLLKQELDTIINSETQKRLHFR